MPHKDPMAYSWITYAGVILMASWGGLVNWLRKVKLGESNKANLVELIGEMTTSGFAGVLVFWTCEAMGVQPLITAVFVGIGGHMGGRTLRVFEDMLKRRIGKIGD